jgi:hypothetical protein
MIHMQALENLPLPARYKTVRPQDLGDRQAFYEGIRRPSGATLWVDVTYSAASQRVEAVQIEAENDSGETRLIFFIEAPTREVIPVLEMILAS